MTENKMIGFTNGITAGVYLELKTDQKYNNLIRFTYNDVKNNHDGLDYDQTMGGERITYLIFRDWLEQWYEDKIESCQQYHGLPNEIYTSVSELVNYALSNINWGEIAATFISEIETP